MESTCRVCLYNTEGKDKTQFKSLFDEKEALSDKMMKCAQVIVTPEDLLPKAICTLCTNKLNIAYDFKMLCEKTFHDLMLMVKDKGIPFNEIKMEESDMHTKLICIKQEPEISLIEFDCKTDSLIKKRRNSNNIKLTTKKEIEESRELIDIKEVPILKLHLDDYDHNSIDNENDTTSDHHLEESVLFQEISSGADRIKNRKKRKKSDSVDKKPKGRIPRIPRLVCDQCGQTFTNHTSLQGHQRRHKGERLFVCSTCGKTFFVLNELKKHSYIHNAIKPYQCKYCERRFADWSSRLKHERCHRGERPYKCDLCPKTFSYSYVLARHKLTHTGAKPFGCEKCKKNFAVKYQLNNHIRKEHKDQADMQSKDVPVIEQTTSEVYPVVETKPKKHQVGVKKK